MFKIKNFYTLLAIFLMIALGLGVLYLCIHGVLGAFSSFLAIAIPAGLIVLAARSKGDSFFPESYSARNLP